MRRAAGASSNAGFTLVELMVAMGILLVGMTGVLAVYWNAARTAREARDRTISAIVAEGTAAELAAGTLALPLADSPAPNYPRFRRTVTAVPLDDAGEHQWVEIEIAWRIGGGRFQSTTYRTILYRGR